MEQRQPGLGRPDAWAALGVGGLGLLLYARTLAPGLLPDDSGEMQTLSCLLGNTHPTGYPVYVLMGKAFTWIPVRDPAYRVNLLSAFAAALAVAGVYLAARFLTGQRRAALVGALALAVSPTFWSQAVIAEVYAPGAACLVAVVLGLLAWDAYGRAAWLFLAGLAGGLGLGVHLGIVPLAPAAGLFLVVSRRRARAPGRPVWWPAVLGGLTGAGLAVIAFAALDHHAPVANFFDSAVLPSRSAWGFEPQDIDGTFERLSFSVGARQFDSILFTDPGSVMPSIAARYGARLPEELSWPVLALALLGLARLAAFRRRVAVLFGAALVVHWITLFSYDNWQTDVFSIPGWVLIAILAGAGLGWTLDGVRRVVPAGAGRSVAEATLILAIVAVGPGTALVAQRESLRAGRPTYAYPANRNGIYGMPPQAAAVVRALERDAIVFTDWYWLYPLYYEAHVAQGRTDLMFVETIPAIDSPELADSVVPWIRERLDRRPVLFSERRGEIERAGWSFREVQVGPAVLYRVEPAGK